MEAQTALTISLTIRVHFELVSLVLVHLLALLRARPSGPTQDDKPVQFVTDQENAACPRPIMYDLEITLTLSQADQ